MNVTNGNGQNNGSGLSSPDFVNNAQGYGNNPPPAYPPAGVYGAPAMGIGAWMLTLFLVCIPIVNLIMLIVWACGDKAREARVNFARAYLIWTAIQVVLFFFLFLVLCMVSAGMA